MWRQHRELSVTRLSQRLPSARRPSHWVVPTCRRAMGTGSGAPTTRTAPWARQYSEDPADGTGSGKLVTQPQESVTAYMGSSFLVAGHMAGQSLSGQPCWRLWDMCPLQRWRSPARSWRYTRRAGRSRCCGVGQLPELCPDTDGGSCPPLVRIACLLVAASTRSASRSVVETNGVGTGPP